MGRITSFFSWLFLHLASSFSRIVVTVCLSVTVAAFSPFHSFESGMAGFSLWHTTRFPSAITVFTVVSSLTVRSLYSYGRGLLLLSLLVLWSLCISSSDTLQNDKLVVNIPSFLKVFCFWIVWDFGLVRR